MALKRHGVTHLFTLCGGHIQSIYDGCLDDDIRVIDVRHEQTAGHAADAYARVTGRPGVCAVTAGPGVTDVVTAVANAQRAGVPLVVFGGAGPRANQDMGSLQDMNHVELMRPITKWAVSVPAAGRIQEYVDAAFRVAQADVPGPVFLEVPLDLLMSFAEDETPATHPAIEPPRPGGDPRAIDQVAELLQTCERPAFIVGSQIRWSPRREALGEAADALSAPFFLNGMARGGLDPDHPGLMTRSRKVALAQADLVLVFGTPFDFRLGYGRAIHPEAKIVRIDLEARDLGHNRAIHVGIQGDSGLVLDQLRDKVGKQTWPEWLATVRAADDDSRAKMTAEMESDDDPPNPLRVCAEVDRRLGEADVVVGDGGDFVATAAYVLRLRWPQLWMDPGPLGTLGVGPGYAMAAKLTRPDSRVWLMIGDGSFGLHGLEFEALVRQDIPVIAVVGNDAAWTQIRRGQLQIFGPERAVATRLTHSRYDRVVEAVGGFGAYVQTVAELGPALDAAMQSGKPACVNVKIAESDFRKTAMSV